MGRPAGAPLGAANSSCHVQVLGAGAREGGAPSAPSVLLFFDRARYLFNAGEGFQRFCVERRVRLARLSAVFTTRVGADATGGLPGMLLTMADTSCGGLLAGHAALALHGPRGLQALVGAFRTFVNVRDLGLRVREFPDAVADPVLQNELVAITPVVLRPEGAPAPAAAAPVAAAAADTAADGAEDAEDAEPGAKRPRLSNGGADGAGANSAAAAAPTSVACYVCALPEVAGKFLPARAAALGVPRGPAYGALVRGEAVAAVSGRMVQPAEVMEAPTPGPVVLVVDCPSAAYVGALADAEAGLGKWAADAEAREKVALVVHLAPAEVLALPAYREWMAGVGGGAAHVLAAHAAGARVPVLAKSAALQAKLHAVDASVFPLLPLPPPTTAAEAAAAAVALPAGGAPGDSGLRFTLRPLARRGLDRAECAPELDPAAVAAALAAEKPEVLALAAAARGAGAAAALAAAPPACTAPGAADQFVLRFLGTGAAVPSKYRNVTGTLLDLPSADAAMLVDCGEGSLGQLRRCVGAAGAEAVLRRLKLAWISHIHADHHVGLAPLLAARAALLGPGAPPVLVVGPRPLRRALAGYAALEPLAYRFVDAAATTAAPAEGAAAAESAAKDAAALGAARAALGLSRLESVRVVHCAHAYGLVLERRAGDAGAGSHPGWTVAFSGDTRPCPALAAAAAGATLLVHEATFEDALQEEAEAKKHCTTREAVEAGVAAGAYRTLLTHFSQRYPKVPVVDANFGAAVGIAFDLMAVRLTDLPRLPALVPALKELFAEEEEEEEEGGEGEGAGAAEADDASG